MLLGSRNFTLLVTNRFLVTFAMQIQAVAVGWLVYQIKKDPLYLGLIGLTEAIPAIGLALVAGNIVDRFSARRVYQMALLCSAAAAIGLCLVPDEASDLAVAGIFAAALLTGMARAFLSPSQFALLPLTVERSQIGTASAWNSALHEIASLGGPALGGFLYALLGADATFTFVALLVVAGVVNAQLMRLPQVTKRTHLAGGFFSGVRFVFGNQVLLAAMALDMFGVLFGGVTALLPIFASDIFQTGPWGLGILRAALPVGAFVMGSVLIKVSIVRFSGKILLVAVAGFGMCMIGFGLSTSFYVSLALLFIAGACDAISVVTRQTILQLSTPDDMRGRVAAVSSIFIGSSNEIGAFESGVAAKLLGLQPSVIFGGCMTLVVVSLVAGLAPRLAKVRLGQL